MKKSLHTSREGDEQYRSIFEHSAVSLWQEDISRLRLRLGELSAAGVTDLRAHLEAHPEFVQEAVGLIDVTDVNQATLRLLEADRKEQLLGPTNFTLDAVSRAALSETILAIDEGKSDIEADSTAVTFKGKKLSLMVKSHIPPADSAYPRMIVSIVDITARKEAEERERQSANILHSIIESAPDAISVKDRSLRMVLCNSVHSRSIGKEPKEMYGKTDIENGWSAELVRGNPEKGIKGWEKDDLAALSGTTVQVSGIPSNLNNEIRYLDAVKMPLRDQDGAVIGVIGIGFDVTERRRAQDELRKAKEFAENLINTANVMVIALDPDGRVTIFNRVAEEITGYTRAEMVNRSWFETVAPKERYPAVWRKFEKLSREGDIGTFENPILTKSGEERYTVWQNSQILEGGHVAGTLSFGIDVTEQRRAEEALRESEERYRSLYVDSRDAIMMLSPERGFLAGNPAAIKLFACRDEQDFTNRTPAGLSPEYQPDGVASSDKAQEMMRLAMERGSHFFEWTHRRADGTDFPATVLLSRLESSGTRLLQATVHDITERKRMEATLTWERSLFNVLMENLPDYIYFKDLASRFIRTSKSHANLLGLPDPSQAIGKSDADFFSAKHALKALRDEQRIIRTGKPLVDIEERETHPDRPDTWVLTTKMPLHNPAGAIVGTFGISHDITARKLLEEANQQLATLVESADDAIVGMDMDRRITVWNRGAERLYGYSAEEMNGAATSSLIPPELEDEARLMRERVMRGAQITHYETTRLRKDGSKIIVSLTLSAIRDTEGRIVGMASVARDVTAQKALEAQLNRVQRLESLATLAGGVAHQFNNINTVVRGYLELMQSEKGLPARLATYVKAANSGVQKAVDITDRLLALTEPGSEAIALHLDVLARTLLPLHAKRIEEEKVRLVLDLAETPLVQGSEVRLKFVLSSLIGNALDSLLDRPVRMVNIRTGCTKDAAWFEVEDSGCGIPKEDLPRIFSPFFSAKGEWAPPGSPQARLKGVGLSLAISSTTVSEYGGRIDVQSTKGEGSTFRVILPLAAERRNRPGELAV